MQWLLQQKRNPYFATSCTDLVSNLYILERVFKWKCILSSQYSYLEEKQHWFFQHIIFLSLYVSTKTPPHIYIYYIKITWAKYLCMTYKQVQKMAKGMSLWNCKLWQVSPCTLQSAHYFCLHGVTEILCNYTSKDGSNFYQQLKNCHGECLTQHIKPQLFGDMVIKCRASALCRQTIPFA